ncbi:hypothetical protein JHK85_018054 [Glycine max]|nr:hypothetical protein JHK85_018054 [Glycine max]
MPSRNVVPWTTMISGYSWNKQYDKALGLFLGMEQEKGIMPNAVTLIDAAWRVFNEIGSLRNLCSWNSMVVGLAVHGECCKALELYDQMLGEGTSPDDVTFVGLLLACTQGGMVKKGRHIFKSKTTSFYIIPKLEHYGCMVDLLGRAGQLREAYEVIQSMSMKPDSVIWGALLGACSFHGNVELAEIAAESLYLCLSLGIQETMSFFPTFMHQLANGMELQSSGK